jgi:hypothetical protein
MVGITVFLLFLHDDRRIRIRIQSRIRIRIHTPDWWIRIMTIYVINVFTLLSLSCRNHAIYIVLTNPFSIPGLDKV